MLIAIRVEYAAQEAFSLLTGAVAVSYVCAAWERQGH